MLHLITIEEKRIKKRTLTKRNIDQRIYSSVFEIPLVAHEKTFLFSYFEYSDPESKNTSISAHEWYQIWALEGWIILDDPDHRASYWFCIRFIENFESFSNFSFLLINPYFINFVIEFITPHMANGSSQPQQSPAFIQMISLFKISIRVDGIPSLSGRCVHILLPSKTSYLAAFCECR